MISVSPRARLLAAAAIGCLFAVASPARATIVLPATLESLAREASAIVDAEVVAIEARQAAGGRRVERVITLRVIEQIKGRPGAGLQIVVPGGTVGRYRTVVPGAPEFREGERAILILGERDGRWHLLGLHQGVLRIATDETTGGLRVSTPFVSERQPHGTIRRGSGERGPASYADVRRLIANALDAGARRAREQAR